MQSRSSFNKRLRRGFILLGMLFVCMGQSGAGCDCNLVNLLELLAAPSQVDPRGACCSFDNQCRDNVFEDECNTAGETFFQGATCAAVDCELRVQAGACCQDDGNCTLIFGNFGDCQGTFLGQGTSCADCGEGTPDLTQAACCLPDGTCVVDTQAGCEGRDGIFQGPASNCDTADCSLAVTDLSGCCLSDGTTCDNRTQEDCENVGGVFQALLCENIAECGIFVEGACCDGATCTIHTKTLCDAFGQTFKGGGTTCAPNPCP